MRVESSEQFIDVLLADYLEDRCGRNLQAFGKSERALDIERVYDRRQNLGEQSLIEPGLPAEVYLPHTSCTQVVAYEMGQRTAMCLFTGGV